MESGRIPLSKEQLREFIKAEYQNKNVFLGIVTKSDGKHIGNIRLHSINYMNRTGEIGVMIGDKNSRGKGFGAEALSIMANHAFSRLNMNKLSAGLITENIASQKFLEKVGFKLEGTLREHYFFDGKYYDCFRYGLLLKDFDRGKLFT